MRQRETNTFKDFVMRIRLQVIHLQKMTKMATRILMKISIIDQYIMERWSVHVNSSREYHDDIYTILVRHKLTGVCLADILEVIEKNCKQPNLCIRSIYKFRKYFANHQTPIIRQFYCSRCFNIIR